MRGFLTSHSITNRASLIHQFGSHVGEERVFPSMTFNCNGKISNWTFVTDECPDSIDSDTGSVRLPIFKVWSKRGSSDKYTAETTGDVEHWEVNQRNGAVCLITTTYRKEVHFQEGSILGIDENREDTGTPNNFIVPLLYQQKGGPLNYIVNVTSGTMNGNTFRSDANEAEYDYPLVAVDVGKLINALRLL